jgi:GNAT superfamily N-acetyltransferase
MTTAAARGQHAAEDLMLRALTYEDPVVRALESELQQEYVARYGSGTDKPVDPGQFAPPDGMFLVGFIGSEPVASGGFRRHADDVVEITRMYVVSDRRGEGYARRLLSELEDRAAAVGYRRAILETRTGQPEALSLYQSSGYDTIDAFPPYGDDERSRYFGKDLETAA